MNPQTMQQVRQIAQEQLQPFQQNHSITLTKHTDELKLIKEQVESIKKELNNVKDLPQDNVAVNPTLNDKIDNIEKTLTVHYHKIKEIDESLKKYTIDRKKDIQGTVERLDIQYNQRNENIIGMVNGLNEIVHQKVISRLEQLENKDITVDINGDLMLNVFKDYITSHIQNVKDQIESNNLQLKDIQDKINDYELRVEEIELLERDIDKNDIPHSIQKFVTENIQTLCATKNSINIQELKANESKLLSSIKILKEKLSKVEFLINL